MVCRRMELSPDVRAKRVMLVMLFSFVGLICCTDGNAAWVALEDKTLNAFHDYVLSAEDRNQKSLQKGAFLWVDELGGAERERAYERLKRGEVLVRQLGATQSEIPGGLIHDWEGLVFLPGAKLEPVLALLRDYDHQADYYAPDVEKAHIEWREGDHYRVFMRFRRHKVVTVVLDTEQEITYYRDSPTRAHSRSSATQIHEIANPGTDQEREKTPREENGFLWQMETWWRMEERDGGVYVQNEAITLTRNIPTGLGWLLKPFVTGIPKETLEFTMDATRRAMKKRSSETKY